MKDVAAATRGDTLMAGWILRYGVPAQPTSDRGTQFTLAVWAVLCKQLGINHITTTAFHPQANGMVERCHRRLKYALRALLAGGHFIRFRIADIRWLLFYANTSTKLVRVRRVAD